MAAGDPVLVVTVKPDRLSEDWSKEALLLRKWGVRGSIINRSDKHGLVYHVKHDDGTFAWYEPRELRLYDDKAQTEKSNV